MEITIIVLTTAANLYRKGKKPIKLKLERPVPVKEILETELGIDPDVIMAVMVNGQYQKRSYIPKDGDEIILVPPLGGG